jgi:threonine dehydrogenase-like Zn-dependent dehydrogenase
LATKSLAADPVRPPRRERASLSSTSTPCSAAMMAATSSAMSPPTTVVEARDRLVRMSELVAVLGQGYVGLPVAVAAAEARYRVVGFDIDVDRVRALQSGHSYVDDITDERLARAIQSGRYMAWTCCAGCSSSAGPRWCSTPLPSNTSPSWIGRRGRR